MASFMMPTAPGLVDALREYGEESEKNKAKLITWRDEAIENIAELKGGHLSSASANGASFMIGHSGSSTMNMTNAEWLVCLRLALKQINLRYRGSSGTSYGRIF